MHRLNLRLLCILSLIAIAALPSNADNGTTDESSGGDSNGLHWRIEHGKVYVFEKESPVLVFNHAFVEAPEGVDAEQRRRGYIHPLYGLDGEVLTQDFPIDHRHHRGVFWAWPDTTIGDKPLNTWALRGARTHPISLAVQLPVNPEARSITIHAISVWARDNEKIPLLTEYASMTIQPEKNDGRIIDFSLRFENYTQEIITIRGAQTENKGYGGFGVRANATRAPFRFTGKDGPIDGDQLEYPSPWIDVSFATGNGGEKQSGLAIFQNPLQHGYPNDGWLIRHYGYLGASWPHREPFDLEPSTSFGLGYRLYIHRGDADAGNVAGAFEDYVHQTNVLEFLTTGAGPLVE